MATCGLGIDEGWLTYQAAWWYTQKQSGFDRDQESGGTSATMDRRMCTHDTRTSRMRLKQVYESLQPRTYLESIRESSSFPSSDLSLGT